LKGLAGLTTLQSLNLRNTNVTGSGLGHLPTNLQSLNLHLSGGKRKDERPLSAGLKVERLAGLTNLRELDLGGREVTDADLTELARLKKLEKLDLSFTKVTEAGVANLRQALPRCEIRFSK
jgi:internalin A